MNRHIFYNKRPRVGLLLIVYTLSYFFQSLLYSPLFAENPVKKTHLVAVFVDKDIYKSLEGDISWYASKYIQSRISDSKAIVLPIDVQNFAAKDIVAMLENIYFDGVKGSSSDLLGAIFVGNIPLPVVQQDGFIYPSIYPYVDFEDQQFIYDADQNYFVYNDNPNGQPEIWHGLINFDKNIELYTKYFEKLKKYDASPSTYVAPRFWYDDFIGMKATFLQDMLPLYLNNFVFAEDVGYHRYNNLMLQHFQKAINVTADGIVESLNNLAPDLKSILGDGLEDMVQNQVPTIMLSSVIKEMLQKYNVLYPGVFLSQQRDNTQAASRWYKENSDGSLVDAIDSHIPKLVLKDSWVISDVGSGVSPILLNYNTKLEEALDFFVDSSALSLPVPILDTYQTASYSNKKPIFKEYCSTDRFDLYQNYYFGKKASHVVDPQDLSIYKGSFKNISDLSTELIYPSPSLSLSGFTQSLGSSYGVFDTQIEANRGYNLFSAARENDVYSGNKKQTYQKVSCVDWATFFWIHLYCKKTGFTVEKKHKKDYETPLEFSQRNWGGASPLALNQDLLGDGVYQLLNYDYRNAQLPIHDLGGSTAVSTIQNNTTSVAAFSDYASLIKVKTREGNLTYPLHLSVESYKSRPAIESYKAPTWLPNTKDEYSTFQGKKVSLPYAGFDYFAQYKNLSIKKSQTSNTIILPGIPLGQTRAQDPLYKTCGSDRYAQENVYTYKLITSVIKNTSPTTDQINGSKKSKFLEDGIYLRHYEFFSNGLSDFLAQFPVAKDFQEPFTTLASTIGGFKAKAAQFNANSISSSTTESQLISSLNSLFIFDDKLFESQLDEVFNTTLPFYQAPDSDSAGGRIESLLSYFEEIQQTEGLDGGIKTQFLQSWLSSLKKQGADIKLGALNIRTQYTQLQTYYKTLKNLDDTDYGIQLLKTKRRAIDGLQTNLLAFPVGCDSIGGNYRAACLKIDSIVDKLESYRKTISNPCIFDKDADPQFFCPFTTPVAHLMLPDINRFPILDYFFQVLESKVTPVSQISFYAEPGLNQTTKDRPIDSDRNTTFKGLGGDIVKLSYPSLYDVSVYTVSGTALILKTPKEIQAEITGYLISKVKEYNTLLSGQEAKRITYYNTNAPAFNLLAKVPLKQIKGPSTKFSPSPKDHTTSYLPEMYFVDLLKDQLPQIAELLYYQSLPTYLRSAQSKVDDDLYSIRSSFDINAKISYILSGYLTKHDDFGPLTTPAYLLSGYEVAYINSDGNDYIPQKTPAKFITNLQKSQLTYSPQVSYSLQEEPAYAKTINDCKLDSNYSVPLFEVQSKPLKVTSPWANAVTCWWKNIPSNTKFSLSFKIGPSPDEFLDNLNSMFTVWKDSFNQLVKQKPTSVFVGDLSEYWSTLTLAVPVVDSTTIKRIIFQFPATSVAAGSQIAFAMIPQDKDGTIITNTPASYRLKINEGDGFFYDGVGRTSETSLFSDFADPWIYEAPNLTSPRNVTISLLEGDKLINQQLLTIEPIDLTILSDGNTLYKNKKVLAPLKFTLKSTSNIPNLTLSLKTTNGKTINSPVSIISERGLVRPGTFAASGFKLSSSFLIENGLLNISLMPTFKAGEDLLAVQIPGHDPIKILVSILPGIPSTISLSVSETQLSVDSLLTGSLLLTDDWGNSVSGVPIKFGAVGPVDLPTTTFLMPSTPYTFSTKTKDPGGLTYIYAYLEGVPLDKQNAGYKQVTVQKPFLPEKNLNVMYLNLFGSDWGNQRGYGSNHKNYVPKLISESKKLLSVTTQLINPADLKKFVFVLGQNAQVHPFVDETISLLTSGSNLLLSFPEVADIRLSSLRNVVFDAVENFDTFDSSKITTPTFVLLQDVSDDNLSVGKTQINSGTTIFMDSNKQEWATGISITMQNALHQGYSLWDLKFDDKNIATLLFVLPDTTPLSTYVSTILSPSEYAIQQTFADGSTNGLQGIGVYTNEGIFMKKGYLSIEDSADYKLGIGFLSDFKNITLFGDGKSVGESTIPYASSFLINYGDPLLKRISDNIELDELPLDSGIGTQVYSNPGKNILKSISADINNDTLKDLVIIFTDGTVKILKNYGGTNPYRDLGDAIRIFGGIQDARVGDVDNNNYADIIVRTIDDELRVYTNDNGIFDVDGKLVCLNTNAQDGSISQDPSHIINMQIFFDDMDRDSALDIVTNDTLGDIKIFYGGNVNGNANYLSTLPYTCDPNWYQRQKTSTNIVKRYGVMIDPTLYVQDQSSIHLQGWNISPDSNGINSDSEEDFSDLPPVETPAFLSQITSAKKNIKMGPIINSASSFFQSAATQSVASDYSPSPINDFVPIYEFTGDYATLGYKSLIGLSSNAGISVYKYYRDENGGILVPGDEVKVTIVFLGLSNRIKATYIDRLSGPWMTPVDDNDHIVSWKVEEGSYNVDDVSWGYSDEIQFVMDNISLSLGDRLVVSYLVRYQGSPRVTIDVKDIEHPITMTPPDLYPDIIVTPQNACTKNRWDFMNLPSAAHRAYEEIYDTTLQDNLDKYIAKGSAEGSELLNSSFPEAPSVSEDDSTEKTQSDIMNFVNSALAGLSIGEKWTIPDIFGDISLKDMLDGNANISLNMDGIDSAMGPVMSVVDKAADGLCNGFKIGKGGCQPPVPFNMIPFNQAFLAPGDYHLFGCTPKLPHPLAPVFTMINKTIGAGMPVMYFPGNLPIPLPPLFVPMISTSFIPVPNQGPLDGFGIKMGGLPILPLPGGISSSFIRLYLVPTLTLQMGVAICFGPYKAGAKIPKLLRDLGGNCIVTAFPLYKNSCETPVVPKDKVPTEVLDFWMTELPANGSCENSIQISKAPTQISKGNILVMSNTITSSVRTVSRGAASSAWTQSVPGGNLLGGAIVSFNEIPVKVSPSTYSSFNGSPTPNAFAVQDTKTDMLFADMKFEGVKPVNLKILGANAKGIIKMFAQDWLGRQTKYMMNNLTKLTISITLPNLLDLADGFDQINIDAKAQELLEQKNKEQNIKEAKTQDNVSAPSMLNSIAKLASKNNISAASDFVNNPFDSLIALFEEVPLLRLQSKELIVNVPMITTEDVLKYTNYLKTWLDTQQKILKQWVESVAEVMYACGKIDPRQELLDLQMIQQSFNDPSLKLTSEQKTKLSKALLDYKTFLEKQPSLSSVPDTNLSQTIEETRNQAKLQFANFPYKASALPILQVSKKSLDLKQTTNPSNFTQNEKALQNRLDQSIKTMTSCVGFGDSFDKFDKFYADSTKLVTSVKQNIQVLQEYKKFPLQLSKWMGAIDSYLSDISSFLSNTVGTLMQWMSTNAKIYSNYVDALILIISSIKTWQILIDFSVNWNQKCGKCTRDSYGAYSCGLSFLLDKIKLPIIPIPPFKIPNIYIDLSHIDLGMTVELPKIRFVPIAIALPKIPNLPSPPNIDVNVDLDINLTLFDNLTVPAIRTLPSPPLLPELPSFIPKVEFALPILPPAPKIPNLIPSISTTLDFASTLARIFCITKGSFGLVGEKGVKAKVEQITQRTWDVKGFDFFNQTLNWKKDPPLYGFDFQLDGYINFKMNFDPFYNFLNGVVSEVNGFSRKAQNGLQTYLADTSNKAQKAVTDFSNQNLQDINFDLKVNTDVNLDLNILGSNVEPDYLEYDVASTKIKKDLAYFDSQIDDPQIKQKLKTVRSIVDQNITINPGTDSISIIHNEIEGIITKEQKQISELANNIVKYDTFLAQVSRQDAVLVSNTAIDKLYSVNLFSADQATRSFLSQQENPQKLALDTNAGLVDRYFNTLKNTSPEEFGVTEEVYAKTADYLGNLSSTIKDVYAKLDLDPVAYDSCGVPHILPADKGSTQLAFDTSPGSSRLAAGGGTAQNSGPSSTSTEYDITPYIRGVFVPKKTPAGIQMINVVKSDSYIDKIGNNYTIFANDSRQDLNQDGLVDLLTWDDHGVYIKYSHQLLVSKAQAATQSYDTNYYLYAGGSWYIPSYRSVLKSFYPDGDGYVSFGNNLKINLVHPYPEIKNFAVTIQDFDSVKFSWSSHSSLGYSPDGYLVKLNQRIDTFPDKDRLFDAFGKSSQDILRKAYVLFLPKDTLYTGATLTFQDTSYSADGVSFDTKKRITQLLSGGEYSGAIIAVKYYSLDQEVISAYLSEIPRHRQYTKIAALKNIAFSDQQEYVVASPWSNQIVVGRQVLADSIGPKANIFLYRPSIKKIVSEGNDHKGYVGTDYLLQADWADNVAIANMWIQKEDQVISLKKTNKEKDFIQLSKLYFTGETTLNFLFGAEDFQGNRTIEPVRLHIEVPNIVIKDVILTGDSGQITAELSHDIDEGLVSFQRLRGLNRQDMIGTLSNTFGGFSLKPLQTIVTGSVFSFGQDIGFYNLKNNQIGSLSPQGHLTIAPQYANQYQIKVDLDSSLPSLRVLDIGSSDTLFWVHLPPKELVSLVLGKEAPSYQQVPIEGSTFRAFDRGICIKDITQQCLVYVSKLGEIYIPQQYIGSLRGTYFFDTIHQTVVYTLRDILSTDQDTYIAQITLKADVLH